MSQHRCGSTYKGYTAMVLVVRLSSNRHIYAHAPEATTLESRPTCSRSPSDPWHLDVERLGTYSLSPHRPICIWGRLSL